MTCQSEGLCGAQHCSDTKWSAPALRQRCARRAEEEPDPTAGSNVEHMTTVQDAGTRVSGTPPCSNDVHMALREPSGRSGFHHAAMLYPCTPGKVVGMRINSLKRDMEILSPCPLPVFHDTLRLSRERYLGQRLDEWARGFDFWIRQSSAALAEWSLRLFLLRLQQQTPHKKRCLLNSASESAASLRSLPVRQTAKPFWHFSRPMFFMQSRHTPGSRSSVIGLGIWREGRRRATFSPGLEQRPLQAGFDSGG